jgi:hypothetical protein
MLPKTYVENEIRKIKTNHLCEREKQMLPDTMEAAIRYKGRRETYFELNTRIKELEQELRQVKTQQSNVTHDMTYILRGIDIPATPIDNDNEEEEDSNNEDNDNGEASRRQVRFFKPCPKESCNGFLSTQWKCGICNVKVCKDCLEIKIVRQEGEEQHTCKPEDLASALEVKRNCKSCPNCQTKIFRVSGCSQMWCTKCHTAFDWNTGKKVVTNIHNPHYYDWIRMRAANGNNNDNDNDNNNNEQMECGQINVDSILALSDRIGHDINKFMEIHRVIIEVQARVVIDFHLPNLEILNHELRVKFLVDEIGKDEYERQLYLNDKSYLSKKDYSDLHIMLSEQATHILRNLINERGRHWQARLSEIDELVDFYKMQIETLNRKYKLKTKSSVSLYERTMYGRTAVLPIIVPQLLPQQLVPLQPATRLAQPSLPLQPVIGLAPLPPVQPAQAVTRPAAAAQPLPGRQQSMRRRRVEPQQ